MKNSDIVYQLDLKLIVIIHATHDRFQNVWQNFDQGFIRQYARNVFRKANISHSLIHTRTCVYQKNKKC